MKCPVFVCVSLLQAVLSAGCATGVPRPERQAGLPGPEMPMIMPAHCPSEMCRLGEWLACESLPVFAAPNAGTPAIASLARDETFEVIDATSVVRSPGIVRVTRDTLAKNDGGPPHQFVAGDTVYVLDHRGEAFFNVWHEGRIVPGVEVFWPGAKWSGVDISADVLREPDTEFWLYVVTIERRRGWVLSDDDTMLNPLRRSLTPTTRSQTPVRVPSIEACPT